MNQILYGLLVGAYFRPPAALLMEHIPASTPLQLRAEPDNPYDSAAIQVLLDPKDIPEGQHSALADRLPLCGYTIEQLMSGGCLHLGYIAASDSRTMDKAPPGFVGNQQFLPWLSSSNDVVLIFTPSGAPAVALRIDVPEEAA